MNLQHIPKPLNQPVASVGTSASSNVSGVSAVGGARRVRRLEFDWVIAKIISAVAYGIAAAVLLYRVRICLLECEDKHVLAITVAAAFVGLTVPVTLYHTLDHLTMFVRPRLQSQVIRIIWIVSNHRWNYYHGDCVLIDRSCHCCRYQYFLSRVYFLLYGSTTRSISKVSERFMKPS
jgi:hypothetical protein